MNARIMQADRNIKIIEPNRPTLSKQELESVLNCLIQDQLGPGKIVQKFERLFTRTFSYEHSVAVNSLTSAYHLAFQALNIQKGDKIIMSALAPIQAYDSAQYMGADILLLDVERNSFHPSAESLTACIHENSRDERPIVLILDHAFGSPSPFNTSVLSEKNIQVVEDFTTMLGSEKSGQFFGKCGDISICGFSPEDMITTGNGAMIVTSSNKLFKNISGMLYSSERAPNSVSYDYQLSDFQAAMGLEQLSHLGITLSRRRKIGMKYLETILATRHETYFHSPTIDTYLKFPVLVNQNHDQVLRYFNSLHIGISKAIKYPLHHLLNLPRMQFPNAERLHQKSVALPIYPNLTANNVERISSALRGLI